MCRTSGRCRAQDGICDFGGRSAVRCGDVCATWGRCAIDATGACAVGTDADCRASFGCAESGLCVSGVQACAATLEADCLAARICRQGGSCYAWDGRCAPENLAARDLGRDLVRNAGEWLSAALARAPKGRRR